MVLRSFAPAESSDSPTADDFRAVYSVAERPAPSEDIAVQPPKIMTDFILLALVPTVIVGLVFIIALASIK
jgi:hypothetical protein